MASPPTSKSLFPKASKYNPEWIRAHSLGENVLYNLESVTEILPLKPGLRILDLGCGKAASSIFLAKGFKVQVWAVDEAISATENNERIVAENLTDQVFPLQLDARNLPFPEAFFDMVLVIDSYTYFGTDEKYLPYICKFLKPGGNIAIVDVCFTKEIDTLAKVPAFLKKDFQNYWYFIHTVAWWKKLWEKTGLVIVETAELLPAADFIRQEYIEDFDQEPKKDPFARALKKDKNNLISFFRLVGKRSEKEVYLQSYKS